MNDTANFDKHIDVHTLVSSTTNTSFAQIFTNGEYVNHVEAVVRVRPRTEFAFGNAIVATSQRHLQRALDRRQPLWRKAWQWMRGEA